MRRKKVGPVREAQEPDLLSAGHRSCTGDQDADGGQDVLALALISRIVMSHTKQPAQGLVSW
jgi:hypothetical protein